MIFVGDDWAEDVHDIHVMDENGKRLAARRLPEGLSGIRAFHSIAADHAEDPGQVVIGIETDRGLWVNALVAAGYRIYAVNPLAAARYRDRHSVSGAKSDTGDAKLLADLVRTDRHNHRPVAGDSPDAEAVKVLARGHQNLIWSRTHQTNALRSALREYYPAALEAFDDLADRDALAVLGRAPTPVDGARSSLSAITAALKRGGRSRNLDDNARAIQVALRGEQLHTHPAVAAAFAATTRAAVGIITEINRQITDLETTLASHFETHPDADIYRWLPGLGVILGARVLGEFGDDPNRYATAKSRKNYAGTSPLTVASGRKRATGPACPQPSPLRRHRRPGLLRPDPQPRSPRLLRPPPRQRRPAPPSTTRPRQPPRRHPPPPHPLQRTHRLGPPHQQPGNPSRLTTYAPGMSNHLRGQCRPPIAMTGDSPVGQAGPRTTKNSAMTANS